MGDQGVGVVRPSSWSVKVVEDLGVGVGVGGNGKGKQGEIDNGDEIAAFHRNHRNRTEEGRFDGKGGYSAYPVGSRPLFPFAFHPFFI